MELNEGSALLFGLSGVALLNLSCWNLSKLIGPDWHWEWLNVRAITWDTKTQVQGVGLNPLSRLLQPRQVSTLPGQGYNVGLCFWTVVPPWTSGKTWQRFCSNQALLTEKVWVGQIHTFWQKLFCQKFSAGFNTEWFSFYLYTQTN